MTRFARIALMYLVLVGFLANVVVVMGAHYVLDYYHLTARQFASKVIEKAGVDSPVLQRLLRPSPKFADDQGDGHIRATHPRILLTQLANWDGLGASPLMSGREAAFTSPFRDQLLDCAHAEGLLPIVSCWVANGDPLLFRRALALAHGLQIVPPAASGEYGNLWELALAYDLLAINPALGRDDRAILEAKIARGLGGYLELLDDEGASLWHGRTTLASMAWLCAVVLDPRDAEIRLLQRRAQGHFLNVVRAAELSEAWPEGYNYWINTRAFLFVLASSAYVNGLEEAHKSDRIKRLVERIGLWQIYATRPDSRAEGAGDEGPRIDLKDESQRVVDLIAQITRRPDFAVYSNYLESLHGTEGYYRFYRWGYRLFNDPLLPMAAFRSRDLGVFDKVLPTAEIFGQGAMNQVYMRSGWRPDDTFISFRAGHQFTHHGHYDAGHFTLFKGAPLAVNSSTYGDFTSENRLYYSIRTVAKNSLLVMRPGETVKDGRSLPIRVADGGQRVTLSTGSAIASPEQWGENLGAGLHLEGANLLHFEHRPADYSYVAADITPAYNNTRHDEGGWGGKVSSVVRELLYLQDEDRLLVRDRVDVTDADYAKKWLLHTVNRPEVAGLRVLVGNAENGILESSASTASVANGKGRLLVQRILPEDAVMRLIGGREYQYYVEQDGDDHQLNGRNFSAGASDQPWFDVAQWRIEIQPTIPTKHVEFLVALSPSLQRVRSDGLNYVPVKGAAAAASASALVMFLGDTATRQFDLTVPGNQKAIYVLDVPAGAQVRLVMPGWQRIERASQQGVLKVSLPPGAAGGRLKLAW